MSTFEADLGRRIAEARQRAGMTQQALASAVSLDRSALAKIETGHRRVSALELSRIADALDERIEWFLTDAPPAIVSHRNMAEPGAASPEIDRVVERVARAVEFVARHDDQFYSDALPPIPFPTSKAECEQAARNARHVLGVAMDGPLTELAERLATVGVVAVSLTLGPDTADAASIIADGGSVALVNGSLKVGRRRLAMAHEFGHILAADEYTVDWRIDMSHDSAYRESSLDHFARALLLPATSVRNAWRDLRGPDPEHLREAVVRLASSYRVDMATLARRLYELDIIDQTTATTVRNTRTIRSDFIDYPLVKKEELEGLPEHYEKAVLKLYRNETVSAERAIDLLFDTWDFCDLPTLPTLPESAAWDVLT